jgi:S1/P1 nuclease
MTFKKFFSLGFLAVAAAMLAFTPPALAWIDTGHRMVALVAWADLTPTAKANITAILKNHPRYKQDLLAGLPVEYLGDDADRYAFGIAATWPDVVRSLSNPMHAAFSHPDWHYIDIPYCIHGQPQPTDPKRPGIHDIVDALAKNTAELKDPSVSPRDKAIALCWVLHLCGDIHQPLHCCSLYSPQFPNGDQGGNLIYVLRDPPYPDSRIKLHLLWDELPGQYKNEHVLLDIATALRADPAYSRDALKDALAVTDFSAWAKESYALAVKYAYLNGDLLAKPTQQEMDAAGDEPYTPGLPPGYLKDAEEVAMMRVTLAGYRTADLLNSIFDSK